jgi:hypothetical protein
MASRYLDRSVGYSRPLALAASRPRLLRAALGVGFEALRSFFLPQFANVVFRRRAVIDVGHPLDEEIPFAHGHSEKYMEFVKLWMSALYRLWQTYGDEAVPDLALYAEGFRRLYAEAGSVYRAVHTTTRRPKENPDLRFALIHALDPHLNCVPSLHVLIVFTNWKQAADFVARRGGPRNPAQARWVERQRAEAVAITESVLYVKQHSVNCIGASLFYLVLRCPGFTDADARAAVRDLFAAKEGELPAGDLRAAILEVYERLAAAYGAAPERGWRAQVLDFIYSFEEGRREPTLRARSPVASSNR